MSEDQISPLEHVYSSRPKMLRKETFERERRDGEISKPGLIYPQAQHKDIPSKEPEEKNGSLPGIFHALSSVIS